MPSKRDLATIRTLDFLKMSELAELNGIRYSTVKYYSELGLLPYEQKGKRLAKYYPRIEASQRLKVILKLRGQGETVPAIISRFLKK